MVTGCGCVAVARLRIGLAHGITGSGGVRLREEGYGVLFILTGDIQTGKTRWLEACIARLEERSVRVSGVVAPGVWRRSRSSSLEKVGIDNVLLPGRRRVPFAVRRDLAGRQVRAHAGQSERAALGWAIGDEALSCVNAHFERLGQQARRMRVHDASRACRHPASCSGGLLVVDELGRLELECGAGLAAALAVLDAGACALWPHALVVVRPGLVEMARERLGGAPWGGVDILTVGDAAALALEDAVLRGWRPDEKAI